MKKNILILAVAGLFVLFSVMTAWAGDIILDKGIKEKVAKLADETKSIIYVDKRGVEQTQALFKEWTAQFMNLSDIKARESEVFRRVCWLQETAEKETVVYLEGVQQ